MVGHIFFSSVAVDPDFQKQGIGGALISSGLEACRSISWTAVFLVGDPDYYARFGFQMAGPLGFSLAGPVGRFLQVLELAPGALAGIRGEILLHPAFDEVGLD